MKKTSKVIVTVVIIIAFMLLLGLISLVRQEQGYATPGIFGIILAAGLIGGLSAVWKKKKEE